MLPARCYLICCAERTGSTLLANALIATDVAGRPRSYFNRVAHFNPGILRILGDAKDDDSYLDKVISTATTPNGVFAAKVHWQHFLNLIAKVERKASAPSGTGADSVPALLRLHLPDLRYVRLVRRNTVARAISHYRAKKTDRWQMADDMAGEGEPGFDFDEIDALVRAGEAEEQHWRQFFAEHAIAPLDLVYEEMVEDLAGTVRRVLEFLGIPAGNVEIPPPRLRKQSDQLSRQWEARYRGICAEEAR